MRTRYPGWKKAALFDTGQTSSARCVVKAASSSIPGQCGIPDRPACGDAPLTATWACLDGCRAVRAPDTWFAQLAAKSR
ncbi:hypothetical protein Acsp03_36330 [Actinomadura sp. NBRC 104412]|nr:hypothetical protein Acsp03_36330 [Actinomadura sp. NBRC 104412]